MVRAVAFRLTAILLTTIDPSAARVEPREDPKVEPKKDDKKGGIDRSGATR